VKGRSVSATLRSSHITVCSSFSGRPLPNHRRAPHYDGAGNVKVAADRALLPTPDLGTVFGGKVSGSAPHHQITSKDGAGEYMENLRNIYLFVAAIEKGIEYPGSQPNRRHDFFSAGLSSLDSSAFCIGTCVCSGSQHWCRATELNGPYFNLYREN